jgi:hypothetical protein
MQFVIVARGDRGRRLALIVATRYPQITDWLDQRGGSFETAASRPPQDEEFS